jgi:sterol desaturase/sphingolipid hydroxylase (fatty acid hydroxylase superfamily)
MLPSPLESARVDSTLKFVARCVMLHCVRTGETQSLAYARGPCLDRLLAPCRSLQASQRAHKMRLHKFSYYADFAVYAALLCTMTFAAALVDDWQDRGKWLIGLFAGAAIWTLLEYLLHRFVLHRLPWLSGMHAVHHASPRAFVGTPTWLSLTVLFCAIFLPAWWGFSINVASGVLAGVMAGFLWYGILHHVIHHRRPRILASRSSAAAQRHLRHHCRDQCGNFGVTTELWDYVFGTILPRH